MKFPNYLISSLAIVGAFSLIIMACSADNNDNNSTNNVNVVGKYQITGDGTATKFHVIDTETGIVKTYSNGNGPTYTLVTTTLPQ